MGFHRDARTLPRKPFLRIPKSRRRNLRRRNLLRQSRRRDARAREEALGAAAKRQRRGINLACLLWAERGVHAASPCQRAGDGESGWSPPSVFLTTKKTSAR